MLKRPMRPWFGRVVLNDIPAPPGVGPTAPAESLQRAVLSAIAAHTRADGRLDYARLRASSEWAAATACAGSLQGVSLGDLNGRQPRLAFWINVYNALVFHGIVAVGLRRSVWELRGFYPPVCYPAGGFVLSADHFEHGILRGNSRHGWRRRRRFCARDYRLGLPGSPPGPA